VANVLFLLCFNKKILSATKFRGAQKIGGALPQNATRGYGPVSA